MALFDSSVTNKFFNTDKFSLSFEKYSLTLEVFFSEIIEKLHMIKSKFEQSSTIFSVSFSKNLIIREI